MYNRNPWEEMEAIERYMERMMSTFTGEMQSDACSSGTCNQRKIINEEPVYDVCTGESTIHVITEVQGITSDGITVTADNNTIMITIERQDQDQRNVDGPRRLSIALPAPIIPGTIQWNVHNGVLEVSAARDHSTTLRDEE